MGFFLKNLEKAFGKNEPFNLLYTYLSPVPIHRATSSLRCSDWLDDASFTDWRKVVVQLGTALFFIFSIFVVVRFREDLTPTPSFSLLSWRRQLEGCFKSPFIKIPRRGKILNAAVVSLPHLHLLAAFLIFYFDSNSDYRIYQPQNPSLVFSKIATVSALAVAKSRLVESMSMQSILRG